GTGHHRGGSHRRSEPERRDREHCGVDDRGVDHGGVAEWIQPDGLAHLHAGDHHWGRDYFSRWAGPLAPKPEQGISFELAGSGPESDYARRIMEITKNQPDS